MPEKNPKTGRVDFYYLLAVLVLVVLGVVMVFSAGSYEALSKYADPYHYLKLVGMWAGVGLVAMLIAAALPGRVWYHAAPLVALAVGVLLILVLSPLGVVRHNAARWIGVGEFTIMPGELAKAAAIFFVAWFLAGKPERIRSFKRGVAPLLIFCAIYAGLIYKQPSLSTAITVAGIVVGMMFVAGMKWRHTVLVFLCGISVVALAILRDPDGEHLRRVTSFLNPFENPQGDGYQVIQSLLAFGAGGVHGVSLGKSIQKTLYLPEGHNDFIFAIIGEELGLIGCLVVMLIYICLIYRSAKIAIGAPNRFFMLTASGMTIMIALQVVMNIAVVTSSMPVTGVSLPFVSYGGNALVISMGMAGVMLNMSRYTQARTVPSGAILDARAGESEKFAPERPRAARRRKPLGSERAGA